MMSNFSSPFGYWSETISVINSIITGRGKGGFRDILPLF
jgi:hypothetical protein